MTAKIDTLTNINFQVLFEGLPGLFLIIAPDKDYTVLGASKEYFKAMGLKKEDAAGKPLFKVFPPNPDDPDASANNLIDVSIKNVLKTKVKDQMAVVKYDVKLPGSEKLEVHHWSASNAPVLNEKNEVLYIIHQAENVTAKILAEKKAADLMKIALSELGEKSTFIKSNQERVNRILDVLLKYTLLDFSEQIEITENSDEIDAIVVGLNTLSEELKRHIDQLEDTTSQLSAVNKELESFSYSISHDLRAPLRAINGYSRILEEDFESVLNDEGKRLLGVIQYNAKKMGILIDDLLAFSRLGKKELQRSEIDMDQLIEGVLMEVNKANPNTAKIISGTLLPVKADYSLINQVMINLLSNAVKYSSKEKEPVIKISSEKKEGNIIYSVTDNGVGFNKEYAHKLFGVFQRLHSTHEFEGTGVGLAIVQRVVNKHGGKVWADSVLGNGATFHFSIPD